MTSIIRTRILQTARSERSRAWLCLLISSVLLGGGLMGCQSTSSSESSAGNDAEQVWEMAPQSLPLAAPLDQPDIEISGLTWYGDTLVVLPQYPSRAAGDDGRRLYGLPRSALQEAVADSSAAPLEPFPIPVKTQGLDEHASLYEGCEGIVFNDDRVYLAIEGAAEGPGMKGHLLRGRVDPGLRHIRGVGTDEQILPQQAKLANMAYESLLTRGDTVITIFEANGAQVNPSPRAYQFGPELRELGSVSFPTLEYRVTDATALDTQDRFWVINYFYPDEREVLRPGPDSLALRYGEGITHRTAEGVERLVQYRYTRHGIQRTERAPIWFELGDSGRNWEGLARFEDGFLVATDKFPGTILAYVSAPSP